MRVVLSSVLLLACGCAASSRAAPDAVADAVIHFRFDEAVATAARMRAEHPGDPKFERLHRDASVAWLLDRGRRATFLDRDEEAMRSFEEALALDPGSREAATWIAKTRNKMARIWLERALELHASGKLEEAVLAYERSLANVPGDPSALKGLGEAVIQVNWRAGMGKAYFEEGLRSLSKYWLEQARSRFSYSGKYQPDDDRTEQRRGQTQVLLSRQRLAIGRTMEAEHKFHAARNEYRFAAALDPDDAEAKAGIERCVLEARADELLTAARMEIVRGRYESAAKKLEEGEAMTTSQKELFEGARAQIEQARLEKMYQAALALERDSRYEEAIASYGELLARADYYKDALARRDTLAEYVRLASELYEKARGAASDAERIGHLSAIRQFWPEYKDVADQLRRLEGEEP